MSRTDDLIQLSHCSLILDGHTVLDDVSFVLRRGERWLLVGPNGSGKTMLLKMMRGDVWPTPDGRGERRYRFDGEVHREPRDVKHHIAYVGPERQDKYARYGWDLRVSQVVTTGLFDEDIPLTTPSRSQRARVERVLKRFALWGLRDRRMLSLSYGQRRLALVARAFASPAEVLLLDEVFNGLDARTTRKLRAALEQPRTRQTWVLTSHRAREAPSTVTHCAVIEQGSVVIQRHENSRHLSSPLDRLSERRGRIDAREQPPQREDGKLGSHRRSGVPSLALRGRGREGAQRELAEQARAPWLVRIDNANVYRDYRPVIRDLNWTVRRGENWALLGANGSGKSTLLSMIYGDLHPALGGKIERAGYQTGERIEQWKHRVGWMSPELQAAHTQATTLEEIVISGRYASVGLNEPPTRADRSVARRWLTYFDLEALRTRGPRQVSYGQLRLALIARAMVNDPELLLLDEPCAGLDAAVRAHVVRLIEALADRGVQIIMAVHDPEDLPSAITRVLRIKRGGTVEFAERAGDREELIERN